MTATTSGLRFVALPPSAVTIAQLDEDPAATYGVHFEGRRPVPLITGPRGARRRVDHARTLRMASWARRRQRRSGVPAATVWLRVYIPRARLVGSGAAR